MAGRVLTAGRSVEVDETEAGKTKVHAVISRAINVMDAAYGAKGDGTTNDQAAFQAAFDAAISTGIRAVYAPTPPVRYLLGTPGGSQVALTGLTGDLHFFGDGKGTKMKRGDAVLTADSQRFFRFISASAARANLFISDMYIDDNAAGNPLPVPALAPLGPFDGRWQATTTYVVGDTCYNDSGKFYRASAITTGISAGSGGPTGSTMTNITDGGVTWRYVGAWQASATYITGDFCTNDSAKNYYCSAGGASAASGGPTGTNIVGITDNAATWKYSNSFALEHCHMFSIEPTGDHGFQEIIFSNIIYTDPCADGCSAGGNATNTIGNMLGDRIFCIQRNRVRSDFISTASFDSLVLSNSNIYAFETEPNAINAKSLGNIQISNTIMNTLDIQYPTGSTPAQLVNVTVNRNATWFDHKLVAIGCTFNLNTFMRLGRSTGNADIRQRFIGCTFICNKYWTGVSSALLGVLSTATVPNDIEFDDCDFSSVASDQVHFWDDNNNFLAGTLKRFINCRFYGSATVDYAITYRRGQYTIRDCRFNGAFANGHAVVQGATSSTENITILDGNTVTDTGIYLFRPSTTTSGSTVDIWMRDNVHLTDGLGRLINFNAYTNIKSPKGPGSVLVFHELDDDEVDAIPVSGKYCRGMEVKFTDPSVNASGAKGAICITSGTDAAAVWKYTDPIGISGQTDASPGSIGAGQTSTVYIPVTGISAGDFVDKVSMGTVVEGILVSAAVSSTDTLAFSLSNLSGAPINPGTVTLRGVVYKKEAFDF